jgi:hypothetical protein
MPHETRVLAPVEFLLTTLMAKLAIVAVLSTMLVRFPWFRRILLTEKRDWPERLIFAFSLGLPLTAGVVSRLLLNYEAADLTLAGSFLAGLLAGPYATTRPSSPTPPLPPGWSQRRSSTTGGWRPSTGCSVRT